MRILGGYFVFDNADSQLLVSLLPVQIHIRNVERLTVLVELLIEEAADARAGRELVLGRLVEILMVEALRVTQSQDASPGLLRGLSDPRLAAAIRQMHGDMARPWTMAELAREAGMSRSAFFDRFNRLVGRSPIDYLTGWRMALAKDLLATRDVGLEEVARRVGYGSASAFSTAFSRHVGEPPGRFSRRRAAPTGPRAAGAQQEA